ncbi:Iron-sulfur cluster assembly 2 [Manis javanica]|nr:Iron-sulfur cluster assembly 2 [Manis javanica]
MSAVAEITETTTTEMPTPIVFTDSAAAKVADLIAEEGNPDLKLRVFVQGGGCSGFQYGFTFDEITNDDDTTMTKNGVSLLIDAMSYQYLTLDGTIVNTALPTMADALGESPLRMQSVIVAYSLTMAMLIPASGWMADRFRHATRLPVGDCAVRAGLGAVRDCANLQLMVAALAAQGMGGALLMPWAAGRAARLSAQADPQAMSFVAISLVGPLINLRWAAGWWSTWWHWIFLVNDAWADRPGRHAALHATSGRRHADRR